MYINHEKYALVNGVVLDGTRDMTPRTGLAVCVDGDRIAAVCDAADVPEGYARVDLGGKYLLPGLINLHVHLPASGKPRKKPSDPKKLVKLITSNGLMRRIGVKMCEGYARTELLSGVTTIRTVGGVADFDTIIRDAARRGEILSPRVVASNMAVSVPGGHMAGSLAYEARTPEEAAAFVEKIAAEKPDLIKLMITGGVMDAEVVGEPGVLRMQPALVKAACDKAHALGMQVAAHVESPEGVRVALENGVDSIDLDKIRAGDRQKLHACLARNRAGQQRLARARRADKQHALGDARAEVDELARRFQKVDDLLQFLFFLIRTGDVRERRGALVVSAGLERRRAEFCHAVAAASARGADGEEVPDGENAEHR